MQLGNMTTAATEILEGLEAWRVNGAVLTADIAAKIKGAVERWALSGG